MARVLVFNGTDPLTDEQPYGAQALGKLGHTLFAAPPLRRLPTRLREAVHHRYDIQLDRPGLRAARSADLVLAYLEPNIGYPALMKRLRIGPFARLPLVSIVCWAAEDLVRGTRARRERVLRLLGASDLVCFFSSNQDDVFTRYGVPRDKLVVLPFGIDLHRASPDRSDDTRRDIDVLSVGWDRGRDYATLVKALRGTNLRAEIVATPDNLRELALPENVRARGTVPKEEYHRLLGRSRIVVVPTLELQYPTGQSVALEAAAAGCAVIVTDTPAMRDYFTPGVTALMPPPGDPAVLYDAMAMLSADEEARHTLAIAGRAHVRRAHSSTRMWAVLAQAMEDRGVLPAVP